MRSAEMRVKNRPPSASTSAEVALGGSSHGVHDSPQYVDWPIRQASYNGAPRQSGNS